LFIYFRIKDFMTIGIIILLFFQISSGEIIRLELAPSGCPLLVVNVQGAENNPQRVLIDTGSTHSYIINHNMMRSLPRIGELAGDRRAAGIRHSMIPEAEFSSFDATHIDYDEFSGLRLIRWTRKDFTIGSYSWSQKFAVAVLPESELSRWDPNVSGLIGASQASRFAQTHRHFGFIPRRNGEELDLFFNEPINPQWCLDGQIVYAPVTHARHWHFASARISLGAVETVIGERFQILADTGYGTIRLPRVLHATFRAQLQSLNIPSLHYPNGEDRTADFEYQHLSRVPDLFVTLVSDATITISKNGFCFCFGTNARSPCSLYILPHGEPNRIILGVQLFRSHIVEFDTSTPDHHKIGFCEPIDADASAPPPIISPLAPSRDSLIEPFRLADDTVEDDDEESSEEDLPKLYRKLKSGDTIPATMTLNLLFMTVILIG
jgi:hypothetical protein